MEFLNDYISIIAVVAALCVGYIVHEIIPNKEINKFIPAISALVGVVILLWEANWIATPQLIVAGMMSGLAATGLYEQFKNILIKKPDTSAE